MKTEAQGYIDQAVNANLQYKPPSASFIHFQIKIPFYTLHSGYNNRLFCWGSKTSTPAGADETKRVHLLQLATHFSYLNNQQILTTNIHLRVCLTNANSMWHVALSLLSSPPHLPLSWYLCVFSFPICNLHSCLCLYSDFLVMLSEVPIEPPSLPVSLFYFSCFHSYRQFPFRQNIFDMF